MADGDVVAWWRFVSVSDVQLDDDSSWRLKSLAGGVTTSFILPASSLISFSSASICARTSAILLSSTHARAARRSSMLRLMPAASADALLLVLVSAGCFDPAGMTGARIRNSIDQHAQ
jgi:hypothetical protein